MTRTTALLPCLLVVVFLIATPLRTLAQEVETRVVGGSIVRNKFLYPYFAQLADIHCGAALIHDDYLITAAHCENTKHPFYKQVYLGSLRLEQGISRTVQYFQAHPAYLEEYQDFDFALVKLSSSAVIDEATGEPTGAMPIGINRNASIPQAGDPLRAMGFGKTSENAPGMSGRLQQVEIQYFDDDVCKNQYGPLQFWNAVMFCAGVPGGGKDTCQGDSGGPIVDINTDTLVGLVSFGVGCARANYAGVNSRVSKVVDWIESEICKGSDYPPEYCLERDDYVPKEEQAILQDLSSASNAGASFSVKGKLDSYPQEFGWSLTYLGFNTTTTTTTTTNEMGTELFLSMPGAFGSRGATVEKSFEDLPAGQYYLQFGDNGDDGLCCAYGTGFLTLVNDLTGEEVWRNDGKYKGYLQLRFDVDQEGNIEVLFENQDFLPSWAKLTAVNYPPDYDPEFPGPMPEDPLFSFNVNFRFDGFPAENNFRVYYLPGQSHSLEDWEDVATIRLNRWQEIDEMRGRTEGVHNEIVTHRLVDQQPGWYWLNVDDTVGDGICCTHRRGWVSLVAPIITTMDFGLVWGNDGEFGAFVNAYFYMNSDGVVSHVHWIAQVDSTATAASRSIKGDIKEKESGERNLRLGKPKVMDEPTTMEVRKDLLDAWQQKTP